MNTITLTMKQIVAAIESGAMIKLVKDTGIPGSTKLTIKPMWKQMLEHNENFQEVKDQLGDEYGHRKLIDHEQGQVEIFVFDNPAQRKLYQTGEKELLKKEVELIGRRLTEKELTRKVGSEDPLDTDDLLKLEWLLPEEAVEVEEPVTESDA